MLLAKFPELQLRYNLWLLQPTFNIKWMIQNTHRKNPTIVWLKLVFTTPGSEKDRPYSNSSQQWELSHSEMKQLESINNASSHFGTYTTQLQRINDTKLLQCNCWLMANECRSVYYQSITAIAARNKLQKRKSSNTICRPKSREYCKWSMFKTTVLCNEAVSKIRLTDNDDQCCKVQKASATV